MDSWSLLLESHEQVRDPARAAVPEHRPIAAVLACADARVPPSVIFDQDAGRLFVVRVAGNIASPAAIASLDYAIEELDVSLVIVLGHTKCGAVAAACAGHNPTYLEPLTARISQLVTGASCTDADRLGERNVLAAVDELTASSSPVGQAIRDGRATVQPAIYDLATDAVRPLLPALSSSPTNP